MKNLSPIKKIKYQYHTGITELYRFVLHDLHEWGFGNTMYPSELSGIPSGLYHYIGINRTGCVIIHNNVMYGTGLPIFSAIGNKEIVELINLFDEMPIQDIIDAYIL